MFIYRNLESVIFDANNEFNKVSIITGYITPNYIKKLFDCFNGDIYVYVGMGDGKYKKSTYLSIDNVIKTANSARLNVYYTNFDVHAKIYKWSNGNKHKILLGSANFSDSILKDFKEVLGDTTSPEVLDYFEIIEQNSTRFEDVDINLIKSEKFDASASPHTEPICIGDHGALLSLLTSQKGTPNVYGFVAKKYDVHGGGGLNWGFSNAMPKPNDAYIPIPMSLATQDGSIFKTEKRKIDVLWDDGTKMEMLLEGNNVAKDGTIYPKQISSFDNKSILGKYLRKRIGDKLGINLIVPDYVTKDDLRKDGKSTSVVKKYRQYLITKDMLRRYGRYDIEVRNMGNGTYYFDFSV